MRDGFRIRERTLRMMQHLPAAELSYLLKCLIHYYRNGEINTGEVLEQSTAVGIVLIDALDDFEIVRTPDARSTAEYRQWRTAVLERDGYVCQMCGASEKTMHVHHIKPFAVYEELRTEISNGVTLCPACHRKVHSK